MMQHYVGTKITKAAPMTRQAYNDYRGWQLPDNENGADEGYLVEYLDGGAANHPSHAGYISWSPKDVHERAYILIGDIDHLQPHQQRVVAERMELNMRHSKLAATFAGELYKEFSAQEYDLLSRQAATMEEYLYILDKRIAAFEVQS